MKRSLLFILSLVICFCTALFAVGCAGENYTQGLLFTENYDGTGYVVSDLGTAADKTDIIIPSSHNGMPVTRIEGGVFSFKDHINSVTIPDSVMRIDDYAFSSCSDLTSINVSGGNKRYKSIDGNLYTKDGKTLICYAQGKSNLTFTVPDGVTAIADYAFSDCERLRRITLSDSVTSIGKNAFSNCSCLSDITLPDNLKSIEEKTFYGCKALKNITIPDGVTVIADYAFSDCEKLENVSVPDSVTDISGLAFSGCKSLKYNRYDNAYYLGNETNPYLILDMVADKKAGTCEIHENTRHIQVAAFSGCKMLKRIVIPDSVTKIQGYTFENCSELSAVTLPAGLSEIGDMAFYGCYNIKEVFYNGDLAGWCNIEIGIDAFDFLSFLSSRKLYINKKQLTGDLVIPEGVTKISRQSFCNCDGITSVTIPEGVTSIGEKAFYECKSLVSVTIPAGVTEIGESAFYGCGGLTSAIFGNTAGWKAGDKDLSADELSDASKAAFYLRNFHANHVWMRSEDADA